MLKPKLIAFLAPTLFILAWVFYYYYDFITDTRVHTHKNMNLIYLNAAMFIVLFYVSLWRTFKNIDQNKIKNDWKHAISIFVFISLFGSLFFIISQDFLNLPFGKAIARILPTLLLSIHMIVFDSIFLFFLFGSWGIPGLVWVMRRYRKDQCQ